MIRASSVALLIFLVAATGVVLVLGYDVHRILSGMDTKLNGPSGILMRAEGVESKANATLVNLDNGTKVWAASAKDQAGAIQDLATDAHGSLSHANDALDSIPPLSASLVDEVGALHKTTDAATGSVQALTGVLTVAQGTTGAATSLLARTTSTVGDLDVLLKDQAIHRTLDATATTSEQLAALSTDLHIYTHPMLNPDPCKTKTCTFGRVMGKVGGYVGIAASAFSASQWVRPLPVKVSK